MKTDTDKVKPIVPLSPVEQAVRRSNERELKRILGRDLIEAERKQKARS